MSYGIEPSEYMVSEDTAPITAKDYWQDYGLEEDPFSDKLAAEACEVLPHCEQHLDLLQHLGRTSNLLLLVTGEKGIGKTTLMQQFLIETSPRLAPSEIIASTQLRPGQFWVLEEESVQVCQLKGDSSVDPEILLSIITQSFNLPPLDAAYTLAEQFDQQLEHLQQYPRVSLLIIDDAHTLPIETLGSLLYLLSLQSSVQMRFHVLLFGEPVLEEQLAAMVEEQEATEIVYSLALAPLSIQQTAQYLQYRLRNAGLQGTLPLSKADIAYIDKLSQGIPSKINAIARTVMINNLNKSPSMLNSFLQKNMTTLLGGAFLALALVIIFVVFNQNRPQVERAQVKPGNDFSVVQQDTTNNIAVQKPTNLAPAMSNVGAPVQEAPGQLDVAQAPASATSNTDMENSPLASVVVRPANPVNEHVANQVASQTVSQAVTQAPQPHATSVAQVPAQAVAATDLTTPAKANTSASIAAPVSTAANANKPSVHKATTATKKVPPAIGVPKAAASVSIKEGYTLQLIALRSLTEAQAFTQQHHLQGKVTPLKINSQGKEWVVLTYGHYATREQAQAALTKLSPDLQRLKPWPRSASSLQQVALNNTAKR